MDYQQIAARVEAACADGTPLAIVGGGSKDFLGRAAHGERFDVSACRGVVDYDPSELVITVRCGTLLSEVEALLAENGQMLAFEAPAFSAATTMGGVVAAGLSGPRRPWTGSVRDFVLGTVVVNGRGELLTFGGRVMKNVAGYDVSRLMAGALGTLGVVVEISFKVLPAPRVESTLRFDFGPERAREFLASAGLTPVPLSASCQLGEHLYLRLSGTEAGVRAGAEVLGGEAVDEAAWSWDALRHQRHAFFGGDAPLWRVSAPPASPPSLLPGEALTEWGGSLRWLRGEWNIDELNASLAGQGAAATLYRNGDRHGEVLPTPDPVTRRLQARLKHSFDPAGILNPGRMYREDGDTALAADQQNP